MSVINPPHAPLLPFDRPSQYGPSATYTTLGSVPAVVVLSDPFGGSAAMGTNTDTDAAVTQVGQVFVSRTSGLRAADRLSYQGRWYALMGVANWDQDHPFTGDDFGWVEFALRVDPTQMITDLIALRGQQIVLIPATGVATEKPSGGIDYEPAQPRSPQRFVFTVTSGFDGREDAQTDQGLSRKLQGHLLGAHDAAITVGDTWSDGAADYEVVTVSRVKPYNIEAQVVAWLKVAGHSYG